MCGGTWRWWIALANVAGSLAGTRLALKHGAGFVRGVFIVVVTLLISQDGLRWIPEMTGVNPQIRHTELDLPARPEALVQLSLLMAGDDIDLRAASMLIEGDMALASAVMRAVNASFYGVEGRVQTVLQAAQYLGLRRDRRPDLRGFAARRLSPEPLLDAVWARSARRGAIMGRLGQRLGADGWVAHSAGLFEECGKALLVKQAGAQYLPLLRAASDDAALADAEQAAFGVRHDALSSALMQAWGLAWTAVLAVRTRLALRGGGALSDEPRSRAFRPCPCSRTP